MRRTLVRANAEAPDLLESPARCGLGLFPKGFEEAARWQVLGPASSHPDVLQGWPQTPHHHHRKTGAAPAYLWG